MFELDLVRGCDLAVKDMQDERRDLIFSQCDHQRSRPVELAQRSHELSPGTVCEA